MVEREVGWGAGPQDSAETPQNSSGLGGWQGASCVFILHPEGAYAPSSEPHVLNTDYFNSETLFAMFHMLSNKLSMQICTLTFKALAKVIWGVCLNCLLTAVYMEN